MSRTLHHSRRYREQQNKRKQMPWWKISGGPPGWLKQKWSSEVRCYHKAEMLVHPEDPFLSDPRRITDLWDWY